jgi:hypothetical protein
MADPGVDMASERMLRFFRYHHLPPVLQSISHAYCDLAVATCADIRPGPERTVALRKLLEAKDAAVRAKLEQIEIDQELQVKKATGSAGAAPNLP